MNTGEIIRRLKKECNIYEVYHKTGFHCVREAKNGHSQKVEVDILDAGPDVDPPLRYSCEAKSEDGKVATGNPAETINEMLSIVHWDKLDR